MSRLTGSIMTSESTQHSTSDLFEAENVFRACVRRAARGGTRVAPMAPLLSRAADRFSEPMRLALVGQIKRGKSTLTNALLGQQIAATGQLELTFTVSEFRYGTEETVHVRYRDDTVEGPLPPEMLQGLTVRNPDALDTLKKIRSVEFAMPNDLLRTFRLVDTPGLGSFYGADAQNALDYLGVEDEFAAAFGEGEERKHSALMINA
jgi:ribosome biogenesis GTPase A